MILAPGQHAMVPTGLTIALPPGYEAQVRPRSGLAAKHGVTVLNAPGTVDADYRGEINVLLINHGQAPFTIRRGERIAQMVIAPVAQATLVAAAALSETAARQRRLRLDRALATGRCQGSLGIVRGLCATGNKRRICSAIAAASSQIRFNSNACSAFFHGAVCVHGSDSYRPTPEGDIVIRFANGGETPVGESCGLGPAMSGVIAVMRRTLLSCTSLVRAGLSARPRLSPALRQLRHSPAARIRRQRCSRPLLDLDRQEIAALTLALAVLGFSVVAAILLMRTRVGAARNEARLRADIQALQAEADRFRALLFAEPQVLIAWAAGDERPQISGDTSLLISKDPQNLSPQRILAFGTWLPPEPALQMDHAVDALRDAGEGFLLNLTTSAGRSIEAMGRAIGGQAIVRIRELSGLRRELAEMTFRHKTLLEETEMLRGFAAAAPWPIWARRAGGGLSFANAAYARATEAASVGDAIERNLELLDSERPRSIWRARSTTTSRSRRGCRSSSAASGACSTSTPSTSAAAAPASPSTPARPRR